MFYLNFDDFSMFKFKSAIFLLLFPITFTESIINMWSKLIPASGVSSGKEDDEFSVFDNE